MSWVYLKSNKASTHRQRSRLDKVQPTAGGVIALAIALNSVLCASTEFDPHGPPSG